MSRNNSHARKLERKQAAARLQGAHKSFWTDLSLSDKVEITASRPGNSKRELTRLLGKGWDKR